MSDTPQTDDLARGNHVVPTEWAEQLEGERDEAMKTLTDIHRWIERNHPDGFIDSLTFSQNLERVADRWYERLERVERERDRARALAEEFHRDQVRLLMERERDKAQYKLEDARQSLEVALGDLSEAKRERDEARGLLKHAQSALDAIHLEIAGWIKTMSVASK